MKEWLKKNWLWIIAAVLFVAGGPFIINELYKTGKGYVTLWEPKDVLSYYGMILTALGTGIGVFFSIKYSHRQHKENTRRNVLPYFSINILSRKCIDPFLLGWYDDKKDAMGDSDSEIKEELTYKEYISDTNYFIFVEDHLLRLPKLSKDQYDKIRLQIPFDDYNKIEEEANSDVVYIPMLLQNVGQGCAINSKVEITEVSGKRKAASLMVSVPVGEKIYVGLYFIRDKIVSGKFTFKVQYYDIYNNLYEEKKNIEFCASENGSYFEITDYTEHNLVQEGTTNADT